MFFCKYCEIFKNTYFEELCKRLRLMSEIDVSRHQNKNQNRLFKMFVKTVQFSSGYSLFFILYSFGILLLLFLKNTIYSIRFIICIQLYNDFVLASLLPPHDLNRDFLREKEYIRKLAGNYVFTSVLNSKNINNSKNCYDTVQINFQLEGNKCLQTIFINAAETRPEHLRWGSLWESSPSKISKTTSYAENLWRREEKRRSFHKWKQPVTRFLKYLFLNFSDIKRDVRPATWLKDQIFYWCFSRSLSFCLIIKFEFH